MQSLDSLDEQLADQSVDGYLFDAESGNSDQYYLSGFDAPDPFICLYTPDGPSLLISGLEYGRARKDSRASSVSRYSDFDYRSLVEEHGPAAGRTAMIANFLDQQDIDDVLVPERFPLVTADGLRERGISIEVDTNDLIGDLRARKTEAEIEYIREAQRANEHAMKQAEQLLREATVHDGLLFHDGEELTSEHVKQAIEIALIEKNCALDDTIVACGANAADPHDRGSGPLAAEEPIVIDIFPQSKASKYHADMTRTFIKGSASQELQRRYELTLEAQEAAFDVIEPGATGPEVHDAVCDVYEAAGYETLRSDAGTETGFIHSTGHGIGLDVHEQPSVSSSGEELAPGHVITIEPGLYDPEVGGIRVEDLVVVTEDGFENLTDYHKDLLL